ncbi:MAG: glucose-6-phosphate isomerase [Eubacteriales bacterium]|nr:glucose-6-phosphate isomerase [Eubacteriales bacterium]
MIRANFDNLENQIKQEDFAKTLPHLEQAIDHLLEGTGPGADQTAWFEWPINYDEEELWELELAAHGVRENSDVLIVIGVGGSANGAKAGIGALSPSFETRLSRVNRQVPEVIFTGEDLNATKLKELLLYLDERDFSLCLISKSGKSLEPQLAFDFLRSYQLERYGLEEAKDRTYLITDPVKGPLRAEAEALANNSFQVPAGVGGRYSVLTPVGLFPMAVAGLDIHQMLRGAQDEKLNFEKEKAKAPCAVYALLRHIMHQQGCKVEALACFDSKLSGLQLWWEQLFAESEGKEGKGLLPISLQLTRDLHSMGQYLQDGQRDLMETFLLVDEENPVRAWEREVWDWPSQGEKSFKEIERLAWQATAAAHTEGGLPNQTLFLDRMDEYSLGATLFFFETACALSAYLLGLNPYDQPGVEAYKSKLRKLLET